MTLIPEQNQAPLADRMRPRTLDEFIGQRHLVGEGRLLRRAIEADRLTSSIFYGPPGCGKTTLASIIARATSAAFVQLNAVTSGVADVRDVLKAAKERRMLTGQATYLLLDECHRWSKAQSDSILPAIEGGTIRFIGSTTENPMVAMTPAIVSRCRIFQFFPLTEADVMSAMGRALADPERGFGKLAVDMAPEAMRHIAHVANGDVRMALGAVELAVLTTPAGADGKIHVDLAVAEESIQKPMLRCDESLYYDMLSAFCKSLRGSDSDAALAWFARLLYAGVDPRLIMRRVLAHASEDVGMANPIAMLQAVSYTHLCVFLSPALTLWREAVSDYQAFSPGAVEAGEYIRDNTEEHCVFLTGTQHLNPVIALAGRTIVCGPDLWLYWHGFDTTERKLEIAAFYADPEGNAGILEKYDVDYIYVSSYERADYQVNQAELNRLYEVVFSNVECTIYKVPGE